MQVITVTIQALEDIGKVGPKLKNPATVKPLDITDICFMENGTQGGKLSVFMVLKDHTGTQYKAEITEDNFHIITGAFVGSVDRFKDLRQARARRN